ncbi:MAG TPA: hypothetical protein VGM72_02420 [Micropepsaceae bacterium]|jgi:hypothetical protein
MGIFVAERSTDFYSDFEHATKDSTIIEKGGTSGRIRLKAAGNRLHVIIEQEPAGGCLIACFREGLERKILCPNMRALADVTGFTGSVDWDAIHAIGAMADWGEGGDSRVAYVVRNDQFAPLIKVLQVLFAKTHHQSFTNRKDATAWLESRDPA